MQGVIELFLAIGHRRLLFLTYVLGFWLILFGAALIAR